MLEIITRVGVADNAIATLRGVDGAIQSSPVAANRDIYDPRTQAGRNLLRAICRTIVADDNLTTDARMREISLRLLDAYR